MFVFISLIVSNDSIIMSPPYKITPKIMKMVASISEKIGGVNANYLDRPSPQLRKENQIKTIHSSLRIEGNTLTKKQITALIESKRIIGPQKDILEVLNAIEVYNQLDQFNYSNEKSFLKAHQILMKGLVNEPGKYRREGVGVVKGEQIEHLAPPFENVPYLMKDLFAYLQKSEEIALIKSCVFHYEMEFIHPFLDGNGRMGRLWQSLILIQDYPVFQFLPFETLISKDQDKYYKELSDSDKLGQSTPFIEYMLDVMDASLDELLNYKNRILSEQERLEYFVSMGKSEFTRKDYMMVFKDVSTATASRDLKRGVEKGLFEKFGEKNKTIYKLLK